MHVLRKIGKGALISSAVIAWPFLVLRQATFEYENGEIAGWQCLGALIIMVAGLLCLNGIWDVYQGILFTGHPYFGVVLYMVCYFICALLSLLFLTAHEGEDIPEF